MKTPTVILQSVRLTRPGGFSLENLDFTLPAGAHLVITGPSGCGKTSLAMALAGRLYVTGTLRIEPALTVAGNQATGGAVPTPKVQLVEQRYTIKNRSNTVDGYYQQRYHSLDNEDAYTVMEELLQVQDDPAKIISHLKDFGIDYLADKTLLTLSSGEHKRFQLVKMLLRPAPIVILDEPFVGLDRTARAALDQMLTELAAKGIQIITLTGARNHFPSVATHVLELKDGAINYYGTVSDYVPGFTPEVKKYDLSALRLSAPDTDSQMEVKRPQSIIRMVDLHIAYADKVIFDRLNWSVFPGERWLLKGPNGAGKSTLLSLIFGDNPKAYANEIYLFGKKRGTGESIWDIKRKMGYVSPELHAFFDKNISVFSTVASGLFDTMGLYRKLSDEQQSKVSTWLEVLGLSKITDKRLSEVSTGQQRLILLLRAFIKEPPVLILDEPCQGLDQWQSEAFVGLVEDYCNATGATLIYISHYISEVPAVVDKVLALKGDGKGGYQVFDSASESWRVAKERDQEKAAATSAAAV